MKDIVKHAMEYQSVELNLDALIDGALVAIRNAKSAMDRAEAETTHRSLDSGEDGADIRYRSNHHRAFYAEIMAGHAVEHAQAWANYFALVEARSRNSVSIKKGVSNHERNSE
uniref:Uncharacterized protein n=1 Tax=viral metagenome TaxID=1070528 RepID=A0A6M3JKU0_9ZZZZ